MSIFAEAHVDWTGVTGLLDLIIAYVSNFSFKSNIKAETLRNGGYVILCLHLLLNYLIARFLHSNESFDHKPYGFLCVGDVYIGVMDRGGQLEVEITQARGLTPKPGSKTISGNPRLKMTVLNHCLFDLFGKAPKHCFIIG